MNKLSFLRTDLCRSVSLLLLAVLSITIFISCEKDPIFQEPTDPIMDPIDTTETTSDIVISHSADLYTGDISGKILNQNLEPLAGAKINIRGTEIRTDENGFFKAQNIQLDAHGTLITASLENYWSITKLVTLSKNQHNQTRLVLLPKTDSRMVEASVGGMVNFSEAVKIDFPRYAFVTQGGIIYTGEVEISAIHLDPDDPNFEMISPGDFRAFNADSELQTLLSLGMAGVELRGSNDEVLELSTDQSATLFIKIPNGSSVEEIPLWHFDEASGYWLEEGMAKREGDFFVGEVGHFSWWNCDIPFSAVKLSGTIIDDVGSGIAGLPVSIILEDQGQNLGREYTGDQGLFCGWIPKDQNLIIQVRNECGQIFYEEAIGAFSEDTDLAAITATGQNIIELCGSLVNCDAEQVSDGYLIVQHDGNKSYVSVDATGNFCSTINICEANNFEVYGIDLDAGLQGMVSTFDLADSPINNLELSACDQVATFFTYQIDNEPEILISDFTISMEQDGVLGFGGNTAIHGLVPSVILDGTNWGNSNFDFGYFNVRLASPNAAVECDAFECDKPNVDIIEYGGIGNPIILKISGTSYYNNDYQINVSGILN